MFCYNCGKELNDDFNLCPYCGADITRYSDETADKAKEYIVEPDVKFELLGRELFFSPRFLEYNTLRKRFFEKAESLEEEYIKFYKSRKHTFVGLFDEEIPEVVQKVTSAVRFGVDVLMEYGIDDIDDTMLANMVVQSGNIKESLGYIYAKAGEIQRYAENLGDYRDIKKASRGHWEGGGFGVTGAVKGAIVAGAFNIGAGAFHGIGDTLTKASDKAKISGMKQELAIDPRVATCLFDTVYDFSTKVFYCVEKLLIENDLIDEYDFDEAAANARAKNYIARIASQASAENVEKAIDILCDCIQQAPYSTILYVHLYNLFTGRKSDIHSAAKFFGNERNYKLSLLSADKKIVDSIKTEPEKTVEEIRKKIESYETLARDNPYLNVATYVKALEKKAIEIEKEAERTSKAQALEKQIKGKQKELAEMIIAGKENLLWDMAECDDLEAMITLKLYYYKLSNPACGEQYAVREKMTSLIQRANSGNKFAEYLVAFLMHTVLDYTPWRWQSVGHKEDKSKYFREAKIFADAGNILAIGDIGRWMCAINDSEQGIEMIRMAAEKLEPFAALKLGNYYREGSKALNIPQNPSMSHYFSTIAFAYGLSENAKTVAGPLATAAEKATAENIQMKVQSEAEETSDEKKSSTSIGTVGPASIEAQSAVGMDKKPLEISDVSPCPKAGEKTQTTNVAEEAKAEPVQSKEAEQQSKTNASFVGNTANKKTPSNSAIKKTQSKTMAPKSKAVAGLLTLFLGLVGAQWFYLNKPVRAIVYLAITLLGIFVVPGAVSFWQLFLFGESIFFFVAKAAKVEKYSKRAIKHKKQVSKE